MNERGFFTIIGLCLLLIAAISIKGVHEFEANYSRGIIIFQAEHELQNAADSALINAINKNNTATQKFTSKKFGTLKVEIRREEIIPSSGKRVFIRRFEGEYLSNGKIKETPLNEDNTLDTGNKNSHSDESPEWLKTGTIWASVASCDNPLVAGKIYRRSFAYTLDGDETIYYLNNL